MSLQTTYNLLKLPLSIFWQLLEYLFKGRVLQKVTGAQFAKPGEYKEFLSKRNKGLLLDGHSLRLSQRDSFQNVAVYGVTGKGKSSVFVKPIIFDKSRTDSVLIVNDMSGDLYAETSGHMRDRGYRVIVLNPHDLTRSHRFNPFLEIKHDNETIHMAQMFVQAVGGLEGGKDSIWTAGAERFVTFFLKCLKKQGMPHNNPHNLYYLFQNFGNDGSALNRFVAQCCYNDPFMINEWKSLISIHEEGILSFIMNATTALKIFANKEVCTLTATSDIDLSTLRKQKTIVYVIAPPQYQKMYRPVISMFFLSFLQACMRELPRRGDLPVYFLYDEFGNSYLPDFDVLATTVRKYNISLMLFMQGINQLIKTYGRENMSVILSGIVTQVSFGAAEQDTAEYFSKRAGQVRVLQRPSLREPQRVRHLDYDLIKPSEIRELADNQILIISDNRKTTLIDTVPSHEHPRYRRLMKKPPAPVRPTSSAPLEFLQL